MHYMLHLPQQIVKFGPLHHQNTMRFGAKHGWYKDYRWKNFMNLPFSLAQKHQLFLAHNMTTTEGYPNSMFIYKGDVVKEGESVTPAEMDPMIVHAIPHCFNGETLFYKTDNVEIDCLQYMTSVGLLISENNIYGATFGCIHEILCCNEVKLFVLDVLVMELYDEEFNSYEVLSRIGNVEVKEFTKLTNKWPLPVYFSDNGEMLITSLLLLYCHTEVIYGQRKVSGYMYILSYVVLIFLVYTEKEIMVWFRIKSKDGKKTVICNAAGLDAAIMKGIY